MDDQATIDALWCFVKLHFKKDPTKVEWYAMRLEKRG